MKGENRVYPICCTSAYCGKCGDSCKACDNFAKLEEFKRWQEETAAVQEDYIWCPLVWTATR